MNKKRDRNHGFIRMHPAGYTSIQTAFLSLEAPAVPHDTRRRYHRRKDALSQSSAKICMLQAPRKKTDIKCAASLSRCRRMHACIYPSRHAEETICKRIPGAGRHPCRTLYNLISPDCCQDSLSAGFSWSCRIPPVSPPSHPD